MSRKTINSVTTVGIDIGKNSYHLIGLEGRFGSGADENLVPRLRLLLRDKQTFSAGKQTINF